MALVTCPECQALISDKSAQCVKCGAPREPATRPAATLTDAGLRRPSPPPEDVKRPPPAWAWVLAFVVISIFLIAFLGSGRPSPADQAKQQALATIDLCWKEQARKSLAPDTARFIASTCERMEQQFKIDGTVNLPAPPGTTEPPPLPPPRKAAKKGKASEPETQGIYNPYRRD